MKAFQLVKNGNPEEAFKLVDIQERIPVGNEVGIKVEAFGINFADIMARKGDYRDCPPLPTVIGYEVVGRIIAIGPSVKSFKEGDRVLAFTRFGGYSQYVIQNADAISKISETLEVGKALALATQYSTAYYACNIATNVLDGEKVLIHAGAGGVGTALIQLCKLKNAKIYATAGSDSKIEYLKKQGVEVAINYNKEDFYHIIKEPIDVAFDSLGARNFRKSYQLLNRGGRIVGYGASSMANATNIFEKIYMGLSFGIFHPAQLLMESRSIIGVNMLRIADYRPDILKICIDETLKLLEENKISPVVGEIYTSDNISKAHMDMEARKTVGKIGVTW